MYRHIRLDKNEPFYIGIGTVQIIKGKYYYYQRAKERSNRNNLWYKIVNKTEYNIEILYETNDFDIICDKEKEFIKLYGRIDLGTGTLCNLTDGGEGVKNLSQEAKDKISKANLGTMRLLEVRHKMSEAKKGCNNPMYGNAHSEMTKLLMSHKAKGNTNWLGKNHSEESKIKISNSRLGSKHCRSRKVIDNSTNIVYNTVTQAANFLKINRGYLSNMLLGKCKNKTNMSYMNLEYDSKK